MIITCPECATRYDLEDERFMPHGRSVRCTACGESWFVPAPEPIEAIAPRQRAPRVDDRPSYSRNEDRPAYGEREQRRDYSEDRAAPAPHASRPASHPAPQRDWRDWRDEDDRAARNDRPAPNFQMDDVGPAETDLDSISEERDMAPSRHDHDRFMASDDNDEGFAASYENEREDDVLFDTPAAQNKDKSDRKEPLFAARNAEDDTPPKGWRKGKQFFVEDREEEQENDPRPFFAKHFSKSNNDADEPPAAHRDRHEGPAHDREPARFEEDARANRDARRDAEEESRADYRRAAHEEPKREEPKRAELKRDDYAREEPARARDMRRYEASEKGYDNRDYYEDDIIPGEATIVDADWEDVDAGAGPGFGRRVREGRRRATALARLEDVRRFEPDSLDDEFFQSLRVSPRELEHAIRKARRRAEYRDKNRLTPWRAFGWSAWVAAVAGAAYAVVAYRDEIVKAAPSAADAYAVVGIETDPSGLKIENVSHRLAMSTGGAMIEITGALRNQGVDSMTAPLLQAEALGPRGELLARWTFKPEAPTVDGGGIVQFTTRNEAPEGVAEVALSFAPGQGVVSAQ